MPRHAYQAFIYSPLILYAVNKEVNFVPQKSLTLRLKETSVTDNHWSVRANNEVAHPAKGKAQQSAVLYVVPDESAESRLQVQALLERTHG